MKTNRQWITGICRGIVACFALSSGNLHAAEVVINAKAEPPKSDVVVVYKVATPVADKARVVNRAEKILGLSGVTSSPGEVRLIENRMTLNGKEVEASINLNGTEFFYSNFSALKLTGKTGTLFSDDTAVRLSLDYLRATGLMPRDEKELKVDHVGGIMQMLSNAKMPEKKAVVVYFTRELDGVTVKNFGSSITVTLTEAKIPTGIQYHWREVASRERVATKYVLGSERINSLIVEDVNRVFAKNAQVVVDRIDYVLYDNGGDYIQPAYCYQGVSKSMEKGVADVPVLGYVQALEKVAAPIAHPAYSAETKLPLVDLGKPGNEVND